MVQSLLIPERAVAHLRSANTRGRGFLRREKTRNPFGPGYALFGPAEAHQFEDFTDNVVIWAVFMDLLGGALPTTEQPA
jgi:hypothetical protein